MSLNIYTSADHIPKDLTLAYFQEGYFLSQTYDQFIGYSNDDFFIPLDITQKMAISIPRSPFGSFIRRNTHPGNIQIFLSDIIADLKDRSVEKVEIHHPADFYPMFPSSHLLEQMEFQVIYADINQHIELSDDWENSIHHMQKRKLGSLRSEGFAFRKMEKDEFETAHKFLSVCRQAQGLRINIEWPQLKSLIDRLPERYHCFGVFREDKISALCITVNVTNEISYYYLPATSPMFRDKSPMVLLIAGMVEFYRNKGFKHLDLGTSSLQGKPQEPLKIFKERMGAIVTSKPTLQRSL